MILVTGGTGFIGQALIRHLVEAGHPVRTFIRPSRRSPNLPKGVPVEVAVTSLADERGLRAAMVGVDTIYHLAGAEHHGPRASLMDTDIQGTRAVVAAAAHAGVDRFFYLSHLGADRASAYPVLKAKAIAEEHIRRSSLDFTIVRSALIYGPGDNFTTQLVRVLRSFPLYFLMPGDGRVLLQPLWVEDLVACLSWAREDEATRGQTYEIGGPEHLTLRQVVEQVMESSGIRRSILPIRPPYLRGLTVSLDHLLPRLPISVYWIDYLAANHTAPLDSIPRAFNLMPARFHQRLAYLREHRRMASIVKRLLGRLT